MIGLANDFVHGGIGAIRFDFNGHGKSDGFFEGMTVPSEIEDLQKVVAWAREQPFTENISLAGHSQGGVVAAMAAGDYGYPAIKALALMAPAAVLRDEAIRGQINGLSYDPVNVPEKITLPDGRAIGRQYVLMAQNLPIYKTAFKYEGPVFILQGEWDRIVPHTYAERFHGGYKNSDLLIVPEEDHSFTKFTTDDAKAVSGFLQKF